MSDPTPPESIDAVADRRDAADDLAHIRALIRTVPDFPREGILFQDITPLLGNGAVASDAYDRLVELVADERIDVVAAPEARGFIFGTAVAVRLGCGFVPIRKPGKLPYETTTVTYALEYGEDSVSMHVDAVGPGQRVLLVDDVLATGGTMRACAELVESRGALVSSCLFFLELGPLGGRDVLKDFPVRSLIQE